MKNLENIVKALHTSNCFTAEGISKLISFIGKEDLCLEILMGDYKVPNFLSYVVDEKGIVWDFKDYNPFEDKVTGISKERIVYAKTIEDFQKGDYKTYYEKGMYGFYKKVDLYVDHFSSYQWEKMQELDYTQHCVNSLEDIYTPVQKEYLRKKNLLWEEKK